MIQIYHSNNYDSGDIDDLIFKDEPWYQSER